MAKQCVSVRWRASCPSTDWDAASGTNRFTAGGCALQVVNVLCFFDLTGSIPLHPWLRMAWAGALRPCPVTCFATRSGPTRWWFHWLRRAERRLLGLNLPQAVLRNLLLHMRAAMVQQLLKVLFRGLHIVLG